MLLVRCHHDKKWCDVVVELYLLLLVFHHPLTLMPSFRIVWLWCQCMVCLVFGRTLALVSHRKFVCWNAIATKDDIVQLKTDAEN